MELTPRSILEHPVTAIVTLFTALAHVFAFGPIDAVAGVIWVNIAPLFTALSVFAFTVLPNIDLGSYAFVVEGARVAAIIAGVIYGSKLLEQILRRILNEL